VKVDVTMQSFKVGLFCRIIVGILAEAKTWELGRGVSILLNAFPDAPGTTTIGSELCYLVELDLCGATMDKELGLSHETGVARG
jgi:hypothetical protein